MRVMIYNIRTASNRYKGSPHTRRLQKLGFSFEPISSDDIMRGLGYDCTLTDSVIQKELSNDEVIKLSNKHTIIIYGNNIRIYDGYIE